MAGTMTDHAPRLMAQQRRAAELAAMQELSERAAPLFWPVFLLAIAVAFGVVKSAFGSDILYYADIAARAVDMAAQNETLVQLMNGQAFSLGDDGVLRCQIIKYDLVPGVQS